MITYFLQLSAYSLLFYGMYLLLLKRQPYALLSRVFLWATIILPFILPFARFTWAGSVGILPSGPIMRYLPEVTFQPHAASDSVISWRSLSLMVYAGIVAVLFLKNGMQWFRFRKQVLLAEKIRVDDQEIAILPQQGPGSFGKNIFFPDYDITLPVLRHEQAHVAQKHYLDLLILRLIRIFCWPHFLLYFLEKELRLTHEYAADRAAVPEDNHSYAQLLLAQTFDTHHPFVPTFFHHPLKQRIIMLQKEIKTKTGRRLRLKSGLSIALLSAVIVFAQCQKGEDKATVNSLPPTTVQAYKFVEDMPEFKGNVSEYLGRNLRYPEAARDQNKEGRAIIQFIVDKDGKVRDAKVVKSSGTPALDEEGLRVVRAMPEWEPGRQGGVAVPVYFTLPIQFVLTDATHIMPDGKVEK